MGLSGELASFLAGLVVLICCCMLSALAALLVTLFHDFITLAIGGTFDVVYTPKYVKNLGNKKENAKAKFPVSLFLVLFSFSNSSRLETGACML